MNRRWILGLAAVLVASLAWPLAAQDKKEKDKRDAQLRTVRGTVIDKDENTVATGVVYLKNLKTQSIKTSIADSKGQYRFSGLDPNVDYEIHAENDEMTSPTGTISSFDSRKEIVIHLKLTRKKEEK